MHPLLSQSTQTAKTRFALLFSLCLLFSATAHAEAPMRTDDAGTLDLGKMKIEAGWQRDDGERGGELLFGFSPIKNLELEISGSHAKDTTDGADDKLRGVGFGAKWVPYQNETGWSLGARFDFGHTRITDDHTSDRTTEKEYALTGLATYRFANSHTVHMNLGGTKIKTDDDSDTVGTWGIGYEFPLIDKLQLTLETYGEEHSGPDRAIGLRYTIKDGLKVSGAIGQGNDRHFGQVGFAWEF